MKSGFAVLLVVFFATPFAEARFGKEGYMLDISLYYTSDNSSTATAAMTSTSKATTTIYDVNFGKLSEKGIYYGALYTSRSATSGGLPVGEGGTAMGLSLGLFSEVGYYVMAHYLVTAKDGSYLSGSGIQGDVGFKSSLGSDWLIGGNFSYRSLTYKKMKPDDPTFVSLTKSEIMPMLSIGYLF
jgi:hypothetical protein